MPDRLVGAALLLQAAPEREMRVVVDRLELVRNSSSASAKRRIR